jgi:quinolinate synthase
MRLNTLEKLYLCLRDGYPEIVMDEDTRLKALRPVQRMLDMSKHLNPVKQKGD